MQTIWTIGYEQARLDDVIAALTGAGVELLADVRALPLSRRPGFSKTALAGAMAEAGIAYRHMKPLGTPAEGRAAARRGDHAALADIYAGQLELPEALAAMAELRALAHHPKVVAIGEIGLDYYWKKVDPKQQAYAFRQQLGLAADLGLPVIIHNRDATEDTITLLEAWVQRVQTEMPPLAARPFWGVLHAFGGDPALAERAYAWNFVLGIGGPVTFRNAQRLHEVVAGLSLDRLMVETDAPYLTPHPHRGRRNEPAYVALVCAQLAQLQGISLSAAAQATTAVAYRFFGVEQQLRIGP